MVLSSKAKKKEYMSTSLFYNTISEKMGVKGYSGIGSAMKETIDTTEMDTPIGFGITWPSIGGIHMYPPPK